MKTVVTCGAIVLNNAREVLVLRRSDTDERRPGQWDLPGGHVEYGESFEVALRREVTEETGLDIGDTEPRLVYASSAAFDEVSVTWLFFVAKSPETDVLVSPEHDEYKWVGLDEAIDLIEYDRKRNALEFVRDNNLLGTD